MSLELILLGVGIGLYRWFKQVGEEAIEEHLKDATPEERREVSDKFFSDPVTTVKYAAMGTVRRIAGEVIGGYQYIVEETAKDAAREYLRQQEEQEGHATDQPEATDKP